jgi:hypothetical protein
MPVSPSIFPPSFHASSQDACIAIVDARFLYWLHGSGGDDDSEQAGLCAEPPGALRERLAEVLAAVLRDARVHARITRLLWYTSHVGAASLHGQLVRLVPTEAADGGVGLMLAMARDALQLAEQRACTHLLIASDDDRLLPTVDAVQARGLRVHLLADNSALDLPALGRSDPSWASLLRQADTRLIVDDLGRPPLRGSRRERERGEVGPRGPAGYLGLDPSAVAGTADLQSIPPLVQSWLAGLSRTTRLMLQAQLPELRGLPQEADRELLQQISHQLGRPLSVPERKLMRELARDALVFRGLPQDEEEGS